MGELDISVPNWLARMYHCIALFIHPSLFTILAMCCFDFSSWWTSVFIDRLHSKFLDRWMYWGTNSLARRHHCIALFIRIWCPQVIRTFASNLKEEEKDKNINVEEMCLLIICWLHEMPKHFPCGIWNFMTIFGTAKKNAFKRVQTCLELVH